MKNREQNEKGRVKFRFIEFEVEGGNNAIADGLRSVAAALTRSNTTVELKQITSPPTGSAASLPGNAAGRTQAAPQTGDLFAEPAVPVDPITMGVAADDNPADSDDSQGSKPKVKRYYPNCKLVPTLNIESGSVSLSALVAEKKPKTVAEKYMVCAFWLKHHQAIEWFTNDHIYTCFQGIKWTPPKDVGQPLRDMKNKSFVQNDKSEWSLHSNGESAVNRLPSRD